MYKIKVTKASKRDNDKITVRLGPIEEIFANEGSLLDISPGSKFVLTFKRGRRYHDVTFTVSRDGDTGYADCPRGLRMPSVGRPQFYNLVEGVVVYG